MIHVKSHIQQIILFIFLIAGLSLAFRYPHTIVKRPQSVHNWRQCDGLSLTLNYYQEGMHFFHPQTHMLYSDGYKTGYTAPSEAPLLYYFIASLYFIFGEHEVVFRAVNLFFFFIGLYFLFKLALKILKDSFYPAIVLVLLFSSPVLIYYGNNFLPNTTALSMTFAGWYFFYCYYEDGKTGTFLKGVVFFVLASLMKVTELTSVTIIIAMLVAEKMRFVSLGVIKEKHFILKLVSIAGVYALCFGWILFARHYNSVHASGQFMTYTVPIWNMSNEDIRFTLHKMHDIWFKEYFYPATFYLMLAGILTTFVFYRRSNQLLLFTILFLVIGLILYSLLFFNNLGDHDYFYISFYILPAFVFINIFYLIGQIPFGKFASWGIQIMLLVFAVINVIYGSKRHDLRYTVNWMNDYKENISLYQVRPWLDKNGITREDSVIFYPGNYVRPLYLMNRKGWVIGPGDNTDKASIQYDSIEIRTAIKHGAHYLITNRVDTALTYKPLQPYLNNLYGRFGDIYIFTISQERKKRIHADHPN